MTWVLLAILAHVGNGVVFIVDKSLLQTKTAIGKPIAYALYSAAFAGLAIALVPWAHILITPFLLQWAFIGEQFAVKEGFGIAALLAGGMLLAGFSFPRMRESTHGSRIKSGMTMLFPVLAGLLFAAYFAITKYIYSYAEGQFLGIFIVTRVVEAVIAGAGILVFIRPFSLHREKAGKRVSSRSRNPLSRSLPIQGERKTWATSLVFLCNKSLAAGTFLLQTYAISLGSVSVVNALQGVQYAFVLVLALIVSLFFPKIFKEEVGTGPVMQKIAGIVLVSFGVALLV